MARYIDEEKLINKINAYVINNQDVMFIRKLIKDSETEDVAPVVHAHWISLKDDSGYYRHCVCSNCAEDFNNDVSWLSIEMELPLYCPKCGAKMDEEAE